MEQVDDSYFSALADADEPFPISDEKYASRGRIHLPIKRKHGQSSSSVKSETIEIEQGRPSKAAKTESFCKICLESYPSSQFFFNPNCSHAFCRGCFRQYIGAKVREKISAIKCPGENCTWMLEPEDCQKIIPREVFERWISALRESNALGTHKFTCPFKDCGALLWSGEGANVIQSECPNCRRLFCARCGVAWHSGLSCEEVEKLGGDERGGEDLKLVELAKSKNWKRCPNCKYYIEWFEGCPHITCRCNYQFCYGCGKKWTRTHGGCWSMIRLEEEF